jgi:hypothetical protein
MSKKYVSSTMVGQDGRPVKETYNTKTHGVYGNNSKPKILERKQMYQHTGTGLEKAAVERMYKGKGRKVVHENDRSSGSSNSYNYYKGLREDDAPDFDREWDGAAKRYGLHSDYNALSYGNGTGKSYHRSNSNNNGYGNITVEDNRGHYIPDRLKGVNMPVGRSNQPSTHIHKLQPTDPGHRLDVPNNAPIALPSNQNRAQADVPNRNHYNGNVNARAPNRRGKQARIG